MTPPASRPLRCAAHRNFLRSLHWDCLLAKRQVFDLVSQTLPESERMPFSRRFEEVVCPLIDAAFLGSFDHRLQTKLVSLCFGPRFSRGILESLRLSEYFDSTVSFPDPPIVAFFVFGASRFWGDAFSAFFSAVRRLAREAA